MGVCSNIFTPISSGGIQMIACLQISFLKFYKESNLKAKLQYLNKRFFSFWIITDKLFFSVTGIWV